MSAEILLPDGTPAIYDGLKWECPDPKAIPVLEYFTEVVLEEEPLSSVFPNPCADIAERVAAKIIGAKLVCYDRDDEYNPTSEYGAIANLTHPHRCAKRIGISFPGVRSVINSNNKVWLYKLS